MKNKKIIFIIFIVFIIILLCITYVSKTVEYENLPTVTLTSIKSGNLDFSYASSAIIEPAKVYDYTYIDKSLISEFKVSFGDVVASNEMIAEVDIELLKRELNEIKIEIFELNTKISTAESDEHKQKYMYELDDITQRYNVIQEIVSDGFIKNTTGSDIIITWINIMLPSEQIVFSYMNPLDGYKIIFSIPYTNYKYYDVGDTVRLTTSSYDIIDTKIKNRNYSRQSNTYIYVCNIDYKYSDKINLNDSVDFIINRKSEKYNMLIPLSSLIAGDTGQTNRYTIYLIDLNSPDGDGYYRVEHYQIYESERNNYYIGSNSVYANTSESNYMMVASTDKPISVNKKVKVIY